MTSLPAAASPTISRALLRMARVLQKPIAKPTPTLTRVAWLVHLASVVCQTSHSPRWVAKDEAVAAAVAAAMVEGSGRPLTTIGDSARSRRKQRENTMIHHEHYYEPLLKLLCCPRYDFWCLMPTSIPVL